MGAIIALLPVLIPAVTNLISYIGSIKTAAQQTNEWTAEMETAYQAMLVSAASAPEWQPDADAAANGGTQQAPAVVPSLTIAPSGVATPSTSAMPTPVGILSSSLTSSK